MVEAGRATVPAGDQDWEVLVPLEPLAAWMDSQDLPRGPIENPRLLGGGTQNILLRFERGGRSSLYHEADGQRVMKQDEITVKVDLGRGNAAATLWTCDLSHDYVSINADYRS